MTKAIIIGGGHNGLIAATLLAHKGVNCTVLESANELGGMLAGNEFAPGFYAPGAALFSYQLQSEVVEALALEKHGLTFAKSDLSTIALDVNGEHVICSRDGVTGAAVSPADQQAYRDFFSQMNRFGKVLSAINNRRPPKLGYGDRHDKLGLAGLAWKVRGLGKDDLRELLRIGASNIFDVVEEWFDDDLLKGVLALDAVLGSHAGPRSGNTMLTFLNRLSGSYGSLSQMNVCGSSLTDALLSAARANSVDVQTNARVAKINVDKGRAIGVTLESGQTFSADVIVSNADPKTTVLNLVGARHFDIEFTRRINNMRSKGNAARLNLALRGSPNILGLSEGDYGQRLVIAPSPSHVERAFNPAKYGEWSRDAVMEISLASVNEPAVAPDSKCLLSATVQYAPYDLKQGWTDESRQVFAQGLISQLERYMPDLQPLVESIELLSPLDIETRYGASGGHWHHGELSLDQFMFVRPTYGASQYALPLDGLYLCGAGAHPGGGISGAAGRNCAMEILKREGK